MKYLLALLLISSTSFAKDGYVYPCPLAGMENFVCVMDADVAPPNTMTSIPQDHKFKDEMKMKNGKVVIDPVKQAERIAREEAEKEEEILKKTDFASECVKLDEGFEKTQCELLLELLNR